MVVYIWDIIDKYVGFKEKKLIVCILIAFAGLSMLSFAQGWFPILDTQLMNYPILTLRNLMGALIIIIAIGFWTNRL